jgi:hypothetical protein
VLIAADDALQPLAATGSDPLTSCWNYQLLDKFEKAIDLLSDFAKDFPLKDLTSDPNIGGTAGEANISDKSKSATATRILQALKK